jgi:hypothetical protein
MSYKDDNCVVLVPAPEVRIQNRNGLCCQYRLL